MRTIKGSVPAAAGILLFAVGIYLVKGLDRPDGVLRALPYVCVGLGCGLFGQGAGELLNALILRKHPEQAKNLEIERRDERNVMLSERAKAKGFDAMTYIFAALLLAFALMGVSFEVILPFVIAYLLVQFYAVYCRIKQEKEY
ncbi:DUF6442 family protein [Saccharibacillus alkalitolerans]|uniref:DUF2178 domain-containing protein n=1 Tax=Saccharibacillus alkalitolerans TaxID=2705290 RepID=A0ABX0F5J7_9BACL|nr:DUF6442 family protein [Saccharibacillus alkalitolerans]NGZ74819.1 hypothetical protein [Saccharibacillus alkalitolerans]